MIEELLEYHQKELKTRQEGLIGWRDGWSPYVDEKCKLEHIATFEALVSLHERAIEFLTKHAKALERELGSNQAADRNIQLINAQEPSPNPRFIHVCRDNNLRIRKTESGYVLEQNLYANGGPGGYPETKWLPVPIVESEDGQCSP